ncbi:MAG: FkbM family methyltransferase [Verrucomicrobia bacterium]|nr:FkbM family methyltransferase [Verrucomicrobiota bacterium]
MNRDENTERSFWQKSNDQECRDWPYRLSRRIRSIARGWSSNLLVLADEPRAIEAMKRGWDADHFVRLQRWHDGGFRPKVIYDIGAHIGGWSEMCQSIFAPDLCVLFEPQKELQEQAGARRPAGANWKVFPVALGKADDVQPMFVTENCSASSILHPLEKGIPASWGTRTIGQTDIRIAALDQLVSAESLPPPELVKIDVQGYEGHVIAGGKEILSKAQRIVVEVSLHPIYKDQSLLPEIASTFSSWGFEIVDIHETCREWAGRLWQADLWLARTS